MKTNYPLSSLLCVMILTQIAAQDPTGATIAATGNGTSTELTVNSPVPLKFDKFLVTKTSSCTNPERTSIIGKDFYSMSVHIRNYIPAILLVNKPLFFVFEESNRDKYEKCTYNVNSCDGPSSELWCWCSVEDGGVTFSVKSTIKFASAVYGFQIMDPDFPGVKRETHNNLLTAKKACPKIIKAKSKTGAGANVVASLFTILPACIIVASF